MKTIASKKWIPIVAEELRNRLGKEGFHRFMLETFRPPDRPSDENQREPIPVHELITEIPFAAALTSNYDSLLESAYARKWGEVPLTYTQLNVPELSASLQGGFYVLKVHGTIHRIETVILSQKDYREIMYANPAYRHYLRSLFSTKTVLFIGFGLTDPDLLFLLEELRAIFQDYTRRHFALMATEDMSSRLEKDYGIQIIPYNGGSPRGASVFKRTASTRYRSQGKDRLGSVADLISELCRIAWEGTGELVWQACTSFSYLQYQRSALSEARAKWDLENPLKEGVAWVLGEIGQDSESVEKALRHTIEEWHGLNSAT